MAQAIAAEPAPSSSSSWDDVPIVGDGSSATIAGLPEEMILEATLEPVEAEGAPVSPASSGSAFDMLAMTPESAPRIPTFARQAPPPPAATWAEPAPVEMKADSSVFGAAWDNGEADPELAGSPSDTVELASPAEFLTGVAASEEVPLETDLGEFVVESASAAALATNVKETGPSSIDDGKLELAPNSDFIDHSQLTGTGESWSDDRSSLSLEGDDDGDVIQGMVLEEDDPVPAPEPADSWGVAVSQPSPVPAPPPVAVRPPPPPPAPPPARSVPPLSAAAPSASVLQSRVQSAVPVAGPGTSGGTAGVLSGAHAEPVFVPGEHRVILHTVEGQVKRGAIKDAKLGEPLLLLHLATSGTESLPRERVKALFFMLAPGARAPSTEGNKVRVTFKDGRQVAGFSRDHKGATSGFFVVPADNRTNTERIFIFRHAVQSISVDS